MGGGMGFHPNRLEPKHLVMLSEGDVCEIRDAFSDSHRSPQSMGDAGFITEGGPDLKKMLDGLPDLYVPDKASGPETLSERGKQAIERMVAGVRIYGVLISEDIDGAQELRDALNESEVANAYFTISIQEGKPGPERDAAVDRRMAAENRLTDAALAYGLARMRKEN